MKNLLCFLVVVSLVSVLVSGYEREEDTKLTEVLRELKDYLEVNELYNDLAEGIAKRTERCCPFMYCHSVCGGRNCC